MQHRPRNTETSDRTRGGVLPASSLTSPPRSDAQRLRRLLTHLHHEAGQGTLRQVVAGLAAIPEPRRSFLFARLRLPALRTGPGRYTRAGAPGAVSAGATAVRSELRPPSATVVPVRDHLPVKPRRPGQWEMPSDVHTKSKAPPAWLPPQHMLTPTGTAAHDRRRNRLRQLKPFE